MCNSATLGLPAGHFSSLLAHAAAFVQYPHSINAPSHLYLHLRLKYSITSHAEDASSKAAALDFHTLVMLRKEVRRGGNAVQRGKCEVREVFCSL